MFKKFFLVFLSIFLLSLFPRKVFAEGEFATNAKVEYQVEPSGKTSVTHTITLTNLFSNLYATSYSFYFDNLDPQNITAFEGEKQVPYEEKESGERTVVTVNFPDAVVGKGAKRTFSLNFEASTFAVKTGEVWEISIPRISSDEAFQTYRVYLFIPLSFGNEAYLSPEPLTSEVSNGKRIYTFNKDQIASSGVTAGFGEFQIFNFDLKYHLENPLPKVASTEIALPPDTSMQRVYYQDLSPKPDDVTLDEDGNWLAKYTLKPRERIDIETKGAVQIFSGPRSFPAPSPQTLEDNLKPTEFWQSDNEKIKELAKTLKTPKAIYDYVSQTLSYDYERVKPNIDRLGALKALENPKSAICMEFTDTFIALTRAAGIPAREINGYAYTDNPEIQPLSLVADVLHSWPEYWNREMKTWIPVDPTWGSTTGGVDFFNKLDLRHFTFVIHGKNDQKPYAPGSYKLGPNPQKDVFVSFGQLPEERTSHPQIKVGSQRIIPFFGTLFSLSIENPGLTALYNLKPTVLFDNEVKSTQTIEVLPPFAQEKMEVKIPFNFLGKGVPEKAFVEIQDQKTELPTYKIQVIISSLAVIFVLIIILTLGILIKLKKIQISVIWRKLAKIWPLRRKVDGQNFPANQNPTQNQNPGQKST